jgi:hypothetical protein
MGPSAATQLAFLAEVAAVTCRSVTKFSDVDTRR